MLFTESSTKLANFENNKPLKITKDSAFLSARPVASTIVNDFTIDCYIDFQNIQRSLKKHNLFNINQTDFVNFVINHFIGIVGVRATNPHLLPETVPAMNMIDEKKFTIHRNVYCFTAKPVNVHADDISAVKHVHRFLHVLQHSHGFNVWKTTLNFNGHHLNPEIRQKSDNTEERVWDRHEKGVDVALAVRLMSRCLSSTPPKGVIVVSGDADFLPALREVAQCQPDIRIMVTAFSESISGVYFSNKCVKHPWVSPLILNNYIEKLKAMRYRPRKIHSACA